MANYKVLIVDDDDNICQLLNLYLVKEGYVTSICNNGSDAIRKVKADNFNAVLLDIMMPEINGLDTLAEIRKFSSVPVILISAKGEAEDKISGLDCGADDYVTKPFNMRELLSRLKAILRRYEQAAQSTSVVEEISVGNLSISKIDYVVKVGGKKIDMTPKEIELLFHLAANPMKAFSREQLLENVWQSDYKSDPRTVDVHVKRIRSKLGEGDSWRLVTVWGVGYKFEIDGLDA